MSIGRIFGDQFWPLLERLEKLKEPCIVGELAPVADVHAAVEILKKLGMPIRIEQWADNHERVIPPSRPYKVDFSLTVCDWLALQAHFQAFDRYREKAIDKRLHLLLEQLKATHPMLPIFNSSHQSQANIGLHEDSDENLVSELERYMASNKCLLLFLQTGAEIELFPKKLHGLEGGKCLIGQESNSSTLHFIPLREIRSLEISQQQVNTNDGNRSMLEIEEFINSICAVNGERIRLILKVLAPEKINFGKNQSVLINPYMTNSSDGQLIWAATVNINAELLNWLYENREALTIIDPLDFREIFEDFCRQKDLNLFKSA